MSENTPQPDSTLAVLVGASQFPRYAQLSDNKSFANSVVAFEKYLLECFALPPSNILNVFDSDQSQDEVVEQIEGFLKQTQDGDTTQPSDLLLYYVGHGCLDGDNYCLALRKSRKTNLAATSLTPGILKTLFVEHAQWMRRYLILDCCYAQEAYKPLMDDASLVARKLEEVLPEKGTAMLCASSCHDAAIGGQDDELTMFSDAFISVLREGEPRIKSPHLSLRQVGDRVKERIKQRGQAPLPEVHSPRQEQGDVADIPLFPNPAAKGEPLEELTSRLLSRYHQKVKHDWDDRWSRVIGDDAAAE